jgi:hypothetical protein
MTKLDKKYSYQYLSTYVRDNRRADTFKRNDGVFGIEMLINNELTRREVYENKALSYAEAAAENFVDGIKNV